MNTRSKLYYPDPQIEKNLYTKGYEWMTMDNWENYSGYYHKYITGEVFTEREWDDKKSRKLVRYREKPESYFKYADITSFTKINGKKTEILGSKDTIFTRYKAPRAVQRQSSQEDIIKGVMNRYFIYKRNEPNRVFFEIDPEQARLYKIKKAGINSSLYGLIEFSWKLDGPEYDVYDGEILRNPGVVDTNKRIVLRHSKKFPKLAEVITNYREHTIYE